jgi:NADPH-dependent curcumin reductase CurA
MIGDYNTDTPSADPNCINIIRKLLKVQYRTHILEGLESGIEGINLLFSGGNNGKLIVQL